MIDSKFSFVASQICKHESKFEIRISNIPPSRIVNVSVIANSKICLDLELIQGKDFSLDEFINCLEDTLATLKTHQE